MKCEFCKNEHDGSYASGRFCNESCKNQFSKSKLDQKAKKIVSCPKCHKPFEANIHCGSNTSRCPDCMKVPYSKFLACKWCGQLPCLRPDICKKHQLFTTLISNFGMNESVIGTIDLYREYERIRTIIYEDYIDNKLSLSDLTKKHKYDDKHQNFSKIINSLGIEVRTPSERISLAFSNGKLSVPINCYSFYKHGWYTTWNNKKVYFRSSYEEDYYKILDSQKIDYEVETLKIQYWDSEQNRLRTAIPDIYIPSTNTIIEIKSQYTFETDKQRMIDKFNAYKQHGYNTKLIVEKIEILLEPGEGFEPPEI